ncbi:MAG: hypothetical protein QXY87_02065 [Saccharolobus sp.]|uniref:Uncharacterized protein n=2 Tax=Saccharolobus shibatae TaxID=2286 RepID=A0A8F5BSM7_9CREN|nr:hypothetical protein [Saccharolobus shibatae]MCH4814299.1 hypothetical protein [Saccharolobus shibatae]QXJ27292.1 hypothetical protein J5U23_00154 [Saccharolobus shibatae B12]QXJ30579.1 hypothetical protein J5U21_00223 [Saccharolobus shibatae]QXJ33616.1 hypothetical protein J5U22_00156 [Saccharolobus shibatae]
MSSNQQQTVNVYTVIKCVNGDYETERPFQDGDYVLKVVGTCPKDGRNLYIVGIYAVVPEEKKGS